MLAWLAMVHYSWPCWLLVRVVWPLWSMCGVGLTALASIWCPIDRFGQCAMSMTSWVSLCWVLSIWAHEYFRYNQKKWWTTKQNKHKKMTIVNKRNSLRHHRLACRTCIAPCAAWTLGLLSTWSLYQQVATSCRCTRNRARFSCTNI